MLTEVHRQLPRLKGPIYREPNGSDMQITRLSQAVLVYGSCHLAVPEDLGRAAPAVTRSAGPSVVHHCYTLA